MTQPPDLMCHICGHLQGQTSADYKHCACVRCRREWHPDLKRTPEGTRPTLCPRCKSEAWDVPSRHRKAAAPSEDAS